MIKDFVGEMLPQKYPFRFVDTIVETDSESYIICKKNVTINEFFFQGHFPEEPIVPGVVIIETAAQAAILLYKSIFKDEKGRIFLLKRTDFEFNSPVIPGDTLIIKITSVKIVESAGIVMAECSVNDVEVAKGKIIMAVKVRES